MGAERQAAATQQRARHTRLPRGARELPRRARAPCRDARRSVGARPTMSISRWRAAACVGARPNDCFTAYSRLRRTLACAAIADMRDWAPVILLYFQATLPLQPTLVAYRKFQET
jgi:hypothetical protein